MSHNALSQSAEIQAAYEKAQSGDFDAITVKLAVPPPVVPATEWEVFYTTHTPSGPFAVVIARAATQTEARMARLNANLFTVFEGIRLDIRPAV